MVLNRIALTGASGMIGRYVLAEMERRGIRVAASSRTRPSKLSRACTWKCWDLSIWKDPRSLQKLFGKVDALFHVGAMLPYPRSEGTSFKRLMFQANVRACLCLGEWALQEMIPVVFLSSACVYAAPELSRITEDAPQGCNALGGFYGLTKGLAEQVFEYYRRQGLRLITLRPSSVYGIGLGKNTLIASFLHKASRNELLELKPPTADRFNLIHASDVAQAMVQAVVKKAWGTYNITGKTPYTIQEIASTCIKAAGSGTLRFASGKPNRPPLERFGLSCRKAERKFLFSPKIDLHHGLEEMQQNLNRKKV
jgi:nucleoside-diphosphate-sugar epimerase